MKRFVLASLVTILTGVTTTASAQLWLKDRANTQGPGIRGGDLEYHPGIAAEVGYDSNYFQRPPSTTGFPVVDTVLLRITPSFSVSTLTTARKDGAPAPPPKVSFSAGAALVYSEFLTHASPSSPAANDGLGTDKNPRNRQFGVLADLALLIAPGRPVGFNIFDNFQRTTQPSLDADPTVGLDRDENRAAGELVYTKTGGLLDWRLGYAFNLTYFENSATTGSSPQDLNNTRHEIYTRGRWRFLPRTALIYDGNLSIIHYNKAVKGVSDSTPLRTRIGMAGLLTDRTAVTLMAGWGASFYKTSAVSGSTDFDSVIGQAEIRYFLTGAAPEAGTQAPSMSSFAIGFTRDFYNSYFGNWYERDRGYVSLNALFAQRFFVGLEAGGAFIKYSDARNRDGTALINGSPTVFRIDASLFLEYRIKDWLGINGSFSYLGDASDASLRYTGAGGSFVIPLKFNRFQALGGLRAMF